jgi:Leucine-rich repeat (LRR) protein
MYHSCLAKDPAKVTPQSLWIAMWASLVSLAAFSSCLVVMILMIQERRSVDQQVAAQQAPANNASLGYGSSSSAGTALVPINYTAAQERWVELRDRLNLTLFSADSSQAKALRYLSLMPSLHDAWQQYAIAVLFYDWGGPYWNLQHRAEFKPQDRWMPDPSAILVTTNENDNGNQQDGDAYDANGADAAQELECSWKGIDCDGHGRVVSLNLTEFNAFNFPQGTLPTEIGMLSGLTALSVPEHGLQGAVPTELAALRSLRELDLRNNQLSSARDWLGQLRGAAVAAAPPALEKLRLGNNGLRDEWGTSELEGLARCSALVEMDFQSNPDLSSEASLVDYAEAWASLESLYVGQTRLSLSLNDQVSSWRRLQVLDADGSRLSGTLSSFLSTEIRVLKLLPKSSEGLQGSIPTEIGQWTELQDLILDYNDLLTSTIPTEIGQATSILLISTKYIPRLTGPIPTELGLLPRLTVLDLRTTLISGTVPTELAKCPELRELRVETTELVGSMPAELCDDSRAWDELSASCDSETVEGGAASDPSKFFECDCCTYCYNN